MRGGGNKSMLFHEINVNYFFQGVISVLSLISNGEINDFVAC